MRYCFLFLFCLPGLFAEACDCYGNGGLAEADVAFKGKVLRVRRAEHASGSYEVRFQVNKWFKGMQYIRTIVVETPCLQQMCCGIPFKRGEVYEVFAKSRQQRLVTSSCLKTKRVSAAP